MEISNKKLGLVLLTMLFLGINHSFSQSTEGEVKIWHSKTNDSLLLLKKNLKISYYIKNNDSIYFYYYDAKHKADCVSFKINSRNHSQLELNFSTFYHSTNLIYTISKNDVIDKSIVDIIICDQHFSFRLEDINSLNSVFLEPIYDLNEIGKIAYLSIRLMEINYQELIEIIK